MEKDFLRRADARAKLVREIVGQIHQRLAGTPHIESEAERNITLALLIEALTISLRLSLNTELARKQLESTRQ